MRHRWLAVILLLGVGLSVTPAAADKATIDPSQEPNVTLEQPEYDKLATLQNTRFPSLLSDVSPDDAAIFAGAFAANEVELAFLNINDGSTTPVNPVALQYGPLSEIRWRDAQTASYVSVEQNGAPVLVSLNRTSGDVMTTTLTLPGFPLSLAPNASRVLLVIEPQSDQSGMRINAVKQAPFTLEAQSPFRIPVRRSFFTRTGPTRFDADKPDFKISALPLTLASLDLTTGEVLPLADLPEGTGIVSAPEWTPDGSKVTLVRMALPQISREGTPLADPTTQESLGNLPPADNPFLQSNVVDLYDLGKRDLRPAAIKAADGNGDIFSRAGWSTDGQTLMTQMVRPAKLTGRTYATYLQPDRAYLRFYDAGGIQIGTFDRPEIEAPSAAMPMWVSPDELFINAPRGLSYRLYYYNRVSGEFRQVSQNEGTYYQVRSTRLSRQLIYTYSSFQQPYEAYRISWDGGATTPLTSFNGEAAAANQVRADPVSFTLKSIGKRTGYLIQPAGAAFPPKRTKIVVWQQGGPGSTMTNEWGARVEQPFNLLPNFGSALLILPLQSREGYGPKNINGLADGRNFGQIDIDAQAEAVQQLIQQGYTTRGNVGITGCSYGGYFTSQSIARYPTLYAAANTQCTLLDLFNEWQFGFTPVVSYLEGRTPTSDPAEYVKDSPINNATRVRTPLLIFAGTRDFLPYTISGNFHDQIEANKVPVKFVLFEGEGHGLSAASSQLAAAQEQIAWFRQYLGAQPAPKTATSTSATIRRAGR